MNIIFSVLDISVEDKEADVPPSRIFTEISRIVSTPNASCILGSIVGSFTVNVKGSLPHAKVNGSLSHVEACDFFRFYDECVSNARGRGK